jgi:hypothetical protein
VECNAMQTHASYKPFTGEAASHQAAGD